MVHRHARLQHHPGGRGQQDGARPPGVVPSPLGSKAISIGSIRVSPQLVLGLGTFLVLTFAVAVFYKRTWIGKAMRATAEDRTSASLRGIPPAFMSAAAFAAGGLVAGLGGYVVAPIILANPSSGITYSVDGFLVLAIGGFGSLRGVVSGALAFGAAKGCSTFMSAPPTTSWPDSCCS